MRKMAFERIINCPENGCCQEIDTTGNIINCEALVVSSFQYTKVEEKFFCNFLIKNIKETANPIRLNPDRLKFPKAECLSVKRRYVD